MDHSGGDCAEGEEINAWTSTWSIAWVAKKQAPSQSGKNSSSMRTDRRNPYGLSRSWSVSCQSHTTSASLQTQYRYCCCFLVIFTCDCDCICNCFRSNILTSEKVRTELEWTIELAHRWMSMSICVCVCVVLALDQMGLNNRMGGPIVLNRCWWMKWPDTRGASKQCIQCTASNISTFQSQIAMVIPIYINKSGLFFE